MTSIRVPGIACTCAVLMTLAWSDRLPAQAPRNQGSAQRLIGTWALVGYDNSDAEMHVARGPKPIGLLYYDNTGHVAVQISPDRSRRKFTGPASSLFTGPSPTPEEALDAITGYAAYFGTCSVDDRARTVTHRRTGNLNPGATGYFVRRFVFATDDRLVLEPLDSLAIRSVRLSWERLE